jgi:hypothetical protein
MSNPIFRWSGEYFGFISNERLFDAKSNYLGWVESDGTVWLRDGQHLGELVDGSYVLRNTMRMPSIPRIPRMTPTPPIRPIPSIDRIGHIRRISWVDSLDDFA